MFASNVKTFKYSMSTLVQGDRMYQLMEPGSPGVVVTFSKRFCPDCNKGRAHEELEGYVRCVQCLVWTMEEREKQELVLERFVD